MAQKFTGQIRDQETGLDYFNARFYAASLGRFDHPDPLNIGASLLDPQTWNAYTYVRGNPLSAIDPTGLSIVPCTDPNSIACVANDPQPDGSDNGPIVYDDEWWQYNGNSVYLGTGSAATRNPPTVTSQLATEAPKTVNVFTCASEAANSVSLAGALHGFGIGNSGVGKFITDALGGNAFSGATDLVQSFSSGEDIAYNIGQGLAAGPTQGFGAALGTRIEGTPWASGPVDVATSAIVTKFMAVATGTTTLQTLNDTVEIGSVLGEGAEYATGFGEVKLAYDFATYAASLAGCATGIIH